MNRRNALVGALMGVLAVSFCVPRPVSAPRPRLSPLLSALAQMPAINVPVPWQRMTGHPVLITFFATYCFPCLAIFPRFEELQERYRARGLTVLAVGWDQEGAAVLGPFVEQEHANFPVLLATPELREGKSAFGRIGALPSTVLLDRAGEVMVAFPGIPKPEELDALVRKAL